MKSKIMVPSWSAWLGEAPLPTHKLFAVSSHGAREFCWVFIIQALIPFKRVHPHDHHPKAHLLIPSPGGLVFQHMDLGGHKHSDHSTLTLVSLLLEHLALPLQTNHLLSICPHCENSGPYTQTTDSRPSEQRPLNLKSEHSLAMPGTSAIPRTTSHSQGHLGLEAYPWTYDR